MRHMRTLTGIIVLGLFGCAAEPAPAASSIVTSAPATEPSPSSPDSPDAPAAPPANEGTFLPGSPAGPPPGSSPRRVFVTSAAFAGDLEAAGHGTDGFDGADRLCGELAATAGLGGAFRAFLSGRRGGVAVPASSRVGGAGPWVLMNGQLVFGDPSELVTSPRAPISITEKGDAASGAVWTASRIGLPTPDGCEDAAGESWSSSSSSKSATTGEASVEDAWSDASAQPCSTPARLYCFEL
jgi:hypothetical protein